MLCLLIAKIFIATVRAKLLGQNRFAQPNGYVLTLLHPTYALECTSEVALSIFALTPIASTSVYRIEHRISFFSIHAHLSMEEGSLFCFVFSTTRSTKTWTLQIVFFVSLESSQPVGVHGLGTMMFTLVVQKVLEY